MRGEADLSDRDLYYHYYENPGFHGVARHYGIISERYKLAHYYRQGEWELFDRQTDPAEQDNIYNDPAYAAVVKDLNQRLQQLRTDLQVPETDPEAPWYHDWMIRAFEQVMKLM